MQYILKQCFAKACGLKIDLFHFSQGLGSNRMPDSTCTMFQRHIKNYVLYVAENAPGELYTDQYKVKVNDLVSRSMTLFQGQGPRSIHAPCTMTLTKKQGHRP